MHACKYYAHEKKNQTKIMVFPTIINLTSIQLMPPPPPPPFRPFWLSFGPSANLHFTCMICFWNEAIKGCRHHWIKFSHRYFLLLLSISRVYLSTIYLFIYILVVLVFLFLWILVFLVLIFLWKWLMGRNISRLELLFLCVQQIYRIVHFFYVVRWGDFM